MSLCQRNGRCLLLAGHDGVCLTTAVLAPSPPPAHLRCGVGCPPYPHRHGGTPEAPWWTAEPPPPAQGEAPPAATSEATPPGEFDAGNCEHHDEMRVAGECQACLVEHLRAALAAEKARADRAESALVARHGGEPVALLAELDEARARADAAEKLLTGTEESLSGALRRELAADARAEAASAEVARLTGELRRLAEEWEREATRRQRDSDAAGPRERHTLRLGASFERHHAERIRALASPPSAPDATPAGTKERT